MNRLMASAALAALAATAATPALAGEARGLGAHEHGVGSFNIAVEGDGIAMELAAPGADIVGFEHAAKTEADRAAVEAAKARLAEPLSLFTPSPDAGCRVASADVSLVAEGHDEHAHGDEHGHDHGHDHDDEHAHGDDHGHDHGHDHDDEHAHDDDHGHDDEHAHDHGEGGGHTEFRATYALTCDAPGKLETIGFAYFEAFPNARELEVQMIGPGGSAGFDVTREAPVLEIPGSS